MFNSYWIDKSVIIKTVLVLSVIALIILSVNVRIKKQQKDKAEGTVNYATYEGDTGTMVIVDFDKVTRYFTNQEDGEIFKSQIARHISDSGSQILEWYTEDVKLNVNEKTLTFTLANDDTYECFKVTKTNESTSVIHEYEKETDEVE